MSTTTPLYTIKAYPSDDIEDFDASRGLPTRIIQMGDLSGRVIGEIPETVPALEVQAVAQRTSDVVKVLKGALEGIKDAFKGSALVFSGLGAGIGVGVATLAGVVSFATGGIAAIVLLSVFGGYVVYKAIEGGYDAYDKANPGAAPDTSSRDNNDRLEKQKRQAMRNQSRMESEVANYGGTPLVDGDYTSDLRKGANYAADPKFLKGVTCTPNLGKGANYEADPEFLKGVTYISSLGKEDNYAST